MLVKTREGRPIHISGNDEHPGLQGRTAPRAVADLLGRVDVTMLAKVYRHKVAPVVDLTAHQDRLVGGGVEGRRCE